MGKVSKKALEKHNVSLSPAFTDFIHKATSLPLIDLPSHLRSLSTRWPFPRGDLYNWIETLDRFDSILESFNSRYGLDIGPQKQPFGSSLLLEGFPGCTDHQLKERGFGEEGDRELIEAILTFSRLLLDKCGNRALYNSTDRLNELLNTTSLGLLENTLRLTIFLAHRYSERNIAPPQTHSSFYSFDNDRIVKLAASFGLSANASFISPPLGKSRPLHGKEKINDTSLGYRESTVANPSNFRSLIDGSAASRGGIVSKEEKSSQADWHVFAHVKVVWTSPEISRTKGGTSNESMDDSRSPTTPTPARHQASTLSRTSTFASASSLDSQDTSSPRVKPSEKSRVNIIQYTGEDLKNTSIERVLEEAPHDIPAAPRYDLLHKLRVAYGLMNTPESRTLLLQIRLLSLAILAYICDEQDFPQKVFGTDANPTSRQQLVQQIVSLLQDFNKVHNEASLYLQTLAMECLGVLTHQRLFSTDILSALAPNSNHGLMLLLTHRGLADLTSDDDATDNEIGDDWRDAIFSLPSAFITHNMHSVRQSETVVNSSLVTAYASAMGVTTNKAMRVHLRILHFMKSFFHHFRDGLQVLSTNRVFEISCDLLDTVCQSALELLKNGHGIPNDYRTKITDYQIPYMHQQVIRSMVELVNAIVTYQDGHAERVLRNLVDSPSLLNAFKLILDRIEAFGAHTWSEVVKAIVGFLHNEPTSYTVISEAGITRILLNMATIETSESQSEQSSVIYDTKSNVSLKIPPVADAIVNLSQAFGAVCLTSAGFDTFQASGALEAFFKIFESPDHVKIIKDANTLAMLGSTFDELVRHHPTLKDTVLSIVIVMVARVRHICRSRAWTIGAGPKLWIDNSETSPSVSGGVTALSLELAPQDTHKDGAYNPLKLPDGRILEIQSAVTEPHESIAILAKDTDSDGLTVIDYARPAICFLMNFFENQSLCSAFMEAGASDLVLDFTTLPSLPPSEQTFAATNSIGHELPSVIHMMAETKPVLILPAIVDRTLFAYSAGLHEFVNLDNQSGSCYFEQFVRRKQDHNEMQIDTASAVHIAEQGTKLVKAMTTVLLLVQVLSEIFNLPIYSTRSSHNLLFIQVNIADMLSDLVRMLGTLNAVCYREEIALQSTIPDTWLLSTRPENFSTGDEEVDKILSVLEPPSTPTDSPDSEQQSSANLKGQEILKMDKESVAFKNAQILRYLLIEFPNSSTELFQRLGRGFAGKRRLDAFSKQKASHIADALANAFITQLEPNFLSMEVPSTDELKRSRFGYLVVALSNVRGSFYDDSPSHGPASSRQAFVIDTFRRAGGLAVLTRIGTEFFEELKSCQVSQTMFSANAGLKICLDIFNELTSSKSIIDSNQTAFLKNLDANKPFYFNPAQLLLELRMESLPLTRKIWDSDYADQASNDVVQKLIQILKHVFKGEHELDACQNQDSYPKFPKHVKKKFNIEPKRIAELIEKGYSDQLAREAIYRSNLNSSSSHQVHEEYCRAMQNSPRRRPLPIPADEAEVTSGSGASGLMSPLGAGLVSPNLPRNPSGGIEATLAEVVSSIADNDMDDDDDADDADDDDDDNDNDDDDDDEGNDEDDDEEYGETVDHTASQPSVATGSAMDITNILNESENQSDELQPESQSQISPKGVISVESINAERESIREELVERCNNILTNHQNLSFELAELIVNAADQLSEGLRTSFWENTAHLLVNFLLSMQDDVDLSESRGKQIAATAHLTALVIQDDKVFKKSLNVFQEAFDGLLAFLKMSPILEHSPEESATPWVAPVLLIVERLLSHDAEPVEIEWDAPGDVDQSPTEPRFTREPVLTVADKEKLFFLLMEILPSVGKDKPMALSIVRVLVILTRYRKLAVAQSQRGNLQKLFLMIKQLGSGAQGRLQASFMLILRHIIEDEDIMKQIIGNEIVANFAGRSSSSPRQHEIRSFLQENYHLALRSPDMFVQAASEKTKLISWSQNTLALKQPPEQESAVHTDQEHAALPPNAATALGAKSEIRNPLERQKTSDLKPPVVEHPDGVVHFLLSELLAYKEVEDKAVVSTTERKTATESDNLRRSTTLNTGDSSPDPAASGEKQDKPRFKADDHPIFLYRCFILHCLTELLHSYNRVKIEFINFSRKADPTAGTPSKPRSGILNYILNSLVCSGYVDKDETLACKKKMTLSDWAIRVLVALCGKTSETGSSITANRYGASNQTDEKEAEPELTFVRRFTLEHAIRSFKDATASTEPLQMKYSRLLCLGDLFHRLLAKPNGPEGSLGSHNSSYKLLGRMMFEKNMISVLTSALTDVDLSYPSIRKVIKFVLRPLQELTTFAADLSLNSPDSITSAIGSDLEEVISSTSSVSEMDDEREETPDLFRNSALGMLDPSRRDDSDTSEDEDEDEEMYDDEYDDEMEYDEAITVPNDGEVVSDDELDEGASPIEGISGDQPMDIEFVMDDPTDSTDSDDNDDEDDASDDHDDNDDFEVEMDDEVDEDRADEENTASRRGHDEEDDWEDEIEDDDNDDHDIDVTFEDDDIHESIGLVGETRGGRNELNNLLRVLGEQDLEPVIPPTVPHQLLPDVDDPVDQDDDDDDDNEDDDDQGDEFDENGGMEYDEGFNAMLEADDLDGPEQWGWDEAPPNMFRRHRHSSGMGRGHLPLTVNRRIHGIDPDFHHFIGGAGNGGRRHHHAPPARSNNEDTTNPLLQRPEHNRAPQPRMPQPYSVTVMTDGRLPGLPPNMGGGGGMIQMQLPSGIDGSNIAPVGGHGALLDAIISAVTQNPQGSLGAIPPEGFRLQLGGPTDFRNIVRNVASPPFAHHHHHHHHSGRQIREDPGRVASFTPMTTSSRWHEEARMLFGTTHAEKTTRLEKWLQFKLVPFAQQEERERRRRRAEDEEKAKQEAKEREKERLEAERVQKEEEAREAAATAAKEAKEKEEAEAAAAAAAVAAAAQANTADPSAADAIEASNTSQDIRIEQQADDNTTDDNSASAIASAGAPAADASRPRIFTTIRGQSLDITDLEIDMEYLEALPEELREEVIMQQYTERRQEAQAEGGNASTIDPDFLDALPEDIREEIRQQEAHMQRRRERETVRRQAVAEGVRQAEEMDNDNFFATLDPALRRAILAEQPPEILSTLDPRHAAEGRAQQRGLFFHRLGGDGRDPRENRSRREPVNKDKRQVVQLIDKAGVATLLRLMFLQQQGSLKQSLWQVLRDVCGNRQTRFEVISLLLVVLKEGSADVSAVERSLANLSLRAKASAVLKTPQSLKRTLAVPAQAGLSEDITPMVVVQQCLAALFALCRLGFHVKTIFLREVDVSSSKTNKKGKGKENRTTKYPINDLIGLLNRRLIMESSNCLQALSELLSSVTSPLELLMKKDKDVTVDVPRGEEKIASSQEPAQEPAGNTMQGSGHDDTAMTEAPAPVEDASSVVAVSKENLKEGEEEAKKRQPFEPPVISEHNLRLITSVFVTSECHTDTFHHVLDTIKSLSHIPGTSAVFSKDLIGHVQTLSGAIAADLDELLPLIKEAQSTSDLQGITSAKFSASSADQVKLLRVLQALDYLSAPKKDGDSTEESGLVKSLLNDSYHTLGLGPLWYKLSQCLTAVREKGDTIGFANILLALIESLMVVCKNTPLKDAPLMGKSQDQPMHSPNLEGTNDLEDLFFNFTMEHRKILNDIIRQNPKLMQGHGNFSLLVKNSKVLDFDNKRNYFTKQIHSRHHQQRHVQPPLQLSVRREHVFLDSYKNLYFKSAEEMKYGKLNIRFIGEEGVDAGGVTREWFQVLARGMFDANYALFQPVASDRTTFHPSNLSGINPEHLVYFKFVGRIIGKALHEGRVLDCHFSRAVYKRLLGKSPNLKDLESNDVDYYKSLVWILENDITDILTEEFCVIENEFGEEKIIDLIVDGRNIAVTEDNKKEYVQKLVEYRLTESVKEQLDSFLQGFYDIIPAELVSIFNEQELELLISGLPEIDVDDWKANTEYHNFSPSSSQVVWFWRIVRGMTNEERAKLLQFITGTSKVPLNGFKELEGVSGLTKFNIHKDPSSNRLPTSHTCFNQLDLPAYDSFEILKQNLMTAINLGADYFGFA